MLLIQRLIICGVGGLGACSASTPHSFEPEIAQCMASDDVKIIVEGKFKDPSKEIKMRSKFDDVSSKSSSKTKPDIIYSFRVFRLHSGNSGITDNRTGKQIAPQTLVIREGEAPEGLTGKTALLCFGNERGKIESIHLRKR